MSLKDQIQNEVKALNYHIRRLDTYEIARKLRCDRDTVRRELDNMKLEKIKIKGKVAIWRKERHAKTCQTFNKKSELKTVQRNLLGQPLNKINYYDHE